MVRIASNCSSATRLALCDRSAGPGAIDGVWWPSDSDLRTQLPDLVSVLRMVIGPVRRVVYDPTIWPHAPSRIIIGTEAISVDPYALVARDTIYFIGTHMRDAVLFVVPPSTATETVRRVLSEVTAATRPMSVTSLRRLVSLFTAVS
jgi:hypothetical protein